jgi:hypothetical protein
VLTPTLLAMITTNVPQTHVFLIQVVHSPPSAVTIMIFAHKTLVILLQVVFTPRYHATNVKKSLVPLPTLAIQSLANHLKAFVLLEM